MATNDPVIWVFSKTNSCSFWNGSVWLELAESAAGRVVLLQLLSIHDGAVGVTNLDVMLLCPYYLTFFEEDPPVIDGFPSQRASTAMLWCFHVSLQRWLKSQVASSLKFLDAHGAVGIHDCFVSSVVIIIIPFAHLSISDFLVDCSGRKTHYCT